MPFKANATRRHHIPKQKHKVANWRAYDASLRPAREFDGLVHRRGDHGLAGGATNYPWRTAVVFAAGDPDRADAEGWCFGLPCVRRKG